MGISNKKDIIQLIQADEWMMECLRCVQLLNLPDWWICAGFVRSKVWDTLHRFEKRTILPDVDVIYFDKAVMTERVEKKYEEVLRSQSQSVPWSVKNQARMHLANQVPPYVNAEDAIAKFPETATALGVKLNEENEIVLSAPHGIDDLIHLFVKPTPYFRELEERMVVYKSRVREKNWQATWDQLTISEMSMNESQTEF